LKMKQKTEITFEVEETIILRQSGNKLEAFCPQCQAVVEMITPQLAAAVSKTPIREIFRLIESERLHFMETDEIRVCLNSLRAEK
jgi:hypothetical protein